MKVRSRAPLRVSFAGGGTDVSPYCEEHGGAVLNATIDKYAYASLEPSEDDCFGIRDLDSGSVVTGRIHDQLTYDGTHDLAKAVINRLCVEVGFRLQLHADAPWGTGLGSSSTHIVAVLGAFERCLRLGLTGYELAEMAYQVERKDMGQAGGRQDQFSATFGGFNFVEFERRGAIVNPLRIKPEILSELHYRLVLCSLGRTRSSPGILEDQIERYKANESEVVAALHNTKQLAYEMKRALLTGQVDHMGRLLDEGWVQKRRFSNLISSPDIDEIYLDACRQGAIGGKLLGAGGGGHMLLLCAEEGKTRLTKHLVGRGLECVSFAFEPNGLTVWEVTSGW